MFEMSSRIFVDYGWKRPKAIIIVLIVSYLLGVPSAYSLNFLSNQDYVWGIGLMISGVLIAVVCVKSDLKKLLVKADFMRDWIPGKLWKTLLRYVIPLLGIALISWWMFLSATTFAPDEWFNPLNAFSVMTCVVQWGLLFLILKFVNNNLSRFNQPFVKN